MTGERNKAEGDVIGDSIVEVEGSPEGDLIYCSNNSTVRGGRGKDNLVALLGNPTFIGGEDLDTYTIYEGTNVVVEDY